jgi:TatD DNase family protein
MIDTHCHLDAAEFDMDRSSVHAAALAAGVSGIIVPGVAVSAFPRQKQALAGLSRCVAVYGIHPLYVDRAGEQDLAELRDWLQREQPPAVGEIGLDFYVPGSDVARQKSFFIAQLKLAREFDLPVILHVRRAVDAVLHELRRVGVCGGIAHAFNGSRQQADAFIKLGFKLGFGGAATYDGSRRIRQLAACLPEDSIVLETDAPDIPPAWLDRGRNEPGELPRIAAEIAAMRGVPVSALVARADENARAIFGDVFRDRPSNLP